MKTMIKRHVCYYEHATVTIFDVYAGDDPRDYAAKDYKPMVSVKSCRTMEEAQAFANRLEH